MKHLFSALAVLVVLVSATQAQTLVSTKPYHRIVVLEEFTGIHCGYCPDGHRLATALYNKLNQEPVIINIHSGGYAEPGAGEPDFRTQFGAALDSQAQIAGYPGATINRHVFSQIGATTSMGRGSWDAAAALLMPMPSPVNVGLRSSFDSTKRRLTVDVEAYYTDNAPASTNVINVVLLENDVIGIQYDYGSSVSPHTDYHHMHMLRWMLSGQWGDSIMNTTKGTLVKRTYTYTVPAGFNVANCDVAAFVAEGHNEIYSGAKVAAINGTTQAVGSMATVGVTAMTTSSAATGTFKMTLENILGADETYTAELVLTAPSDWNVLSTVDGAPYHGGEFVIQKGASFPFAALISPGPTSGVGKLDVYLHSKTYPGSPIVKKTVYYMSGVENLLMSHPDAVTYDSVYTRAMTNAGVAKNGQMTRDIFELFSNENALTGLKSVYYNVSWAFPGITDISLTALKTLMDNGTHLFVAGQDFGWDLASTDTNAHANAGTRDFYQNYIHATFVTDGTTANSKFTPIGTDVLFKSIPASVITAPYGPTYFYPDQFTPISPAKAIFNYNSVVTKIGGLRFEAGYKLVYLGVGLEQLTPAAGDMIVSQSKRWFAGEISSVEFDDLIAGGASVYPNPATNRVEIALPQTIESGAIRLYNATGNLVLNQAIEQGSERLTVNVESIANGSYRLCIVNGQSGVISTSLLNIIR